MKVGANFESAFRRLARGGKQNIRDIVAGLPPTEAIELAQQAGLETLDQRLERAEGQRALAGLSGFQPLHSHPELVPVWSHLERQLWRNLDEPVISDDPAIDLGSVAGAQVILQPSGFDHPDDAWMVMGHEVAHAELGHSVRRDALAQLERWGPASSKEFQVAMQEAIWGLEFEADHRGLSLVASRLSDPEALLHHLLETEQGREHPDGLRRAEQARVTLAQCGRPVSDERWADLLESTRATRERYARRADAEEQFRQSLKKFC